jgi:hypothetical protein
MASLQVKRVLFGVAPFTTFTDDSNIEWIPTENRANYATQSLSLPPGKLAEIACAFVAAQSPDGPDAVCVLPVVVGSETLQCITYPLLMTLVMAKLIAYSGSLLDVGPV